VRVLKLSDPRFPQGSGYRIRALVDALCKRLDSRGKVNQFDNLESGGKE
jgi:hypothetical protein